MPERLEARYPAVLEPEEGGGFSVRFVDVERAMTDGETPDEALFDANALGTWLSQSWPMDG